MTTNRKVLISGAGSESGIGFAAAKRFSALGYEVFLTSSSDRVLERAREISANGFVADLTDENQVVKLIEQVASKLNGLDVLVNNAGMTSINAPMQTSGESDSVFNLSFEKWKNSISRNLDTTFLLSKFALPLLRMSTTGRIINISSVTGTVMAMKNDAGYAAAKAGMLGLTKALALDEAKFGITVNAVSPGWIATGSQTVDERREGATTPLGRSGLASEVATTICWLADPENGYLTGQNIVVDGGNSIAEERL